MTTYYKWLRADNSAPIGSGVWNRGEWLAVEGPLVPCRNGLHLCREKDLIDHISERLWIAEIDPSEMIECEDKIVVRRARIVERVETIDDCTLRLFACDCAEKVAHLAHDARSVNVISISRRFARGLANNHELAAAWAAARDAARDAQNRRLMQYVRNGSAAEAMPLEAAS